MKEIDWERPGQHETGVLENHGQGKHFGDPLAIGDLVKLRSDRNYVQIAIKDANDPQAITGEVSFSNDAEALKAVGLEAYETVKFGKDRIFIRVFGC